MKLHQYNFLEQLRFHYNRKLKLESIISKYPPGAIINYQKGKYQTFYLHTYKNGKKTRKYLSKKRDIDLIKSLLKKQIELPPIKEELAFRKAALRSMKTQAKKILLRLPAPDDNSTPFFSQNTIEPKKLKYTTNRGEKVRSKSEKIIADLLFEYMINYKYEKAVKFGIYNNIFPDFTIVSPLSGQTYYWEHNGLTTADYLDHWNTKKQVYEHSNINEGNFLIVTTEEDIDNFREIIEERFTVKRYDFVYKL